MIKKVSPGNTKKAAFDSTEKVSPEMAKVSPRMAKKDSFETAKKLRLILQKRLRSL